ncbi:MAG: ABC transporter ATP-binding protein [Spirochaetes bacterium]|nr:ABC transporter ATP-binding protein [Spirochaetota bacterium]
MKDFLIFENLSKSYSNVAAVKNISLAINKGEIFSLLGPSGCGKTTLLRLCAGFETPDNGRIILDGADITALPPEKRKVNTVFQSYALFPHMTIRENIAFGPKVAGKSKKEVNYEVDKMLALIQLEYEADRKPAHISGGQKQRVAIARALINKPQVLLLDEPLAALDLKLRQRMLIELDQIHDEVGITFLFVTHDQTEAMSLSDRMAVMDKGSIEQVGTPVEIYESPVSSFTAAFIGDTNFLDGWVTKIIDKEYAKINIDGIGKIICFNDRKLKAGDPVHVSIRPEKINMSKTEPEEHRKVNILKGVVENMVYVGTSTKYWVRSGEWLFTTQKLHRRYLLDETPPKWDDDVWISWHADDCYMLEKYREADEQLLTIPDIEEPEDDEPNLDEDESSQENIITDEENKHEK